MHAGIRFAIFDFNGYYIKSQVIFYNPDGTNKTLLSQRVGKVNNKNYYQIEQKIAVAENGIYPLFNENFTKIVKNKNVLDTALKNWQKKYENIGCVTSSYTPKYEILVHRRLGCLSKSYMLEAVRHKSIRGLEKLDKKKIEECIGMGSDSQKENN